MGSQKKGMTNFGFQCTADEKKLAKQLATASGMELSNYLRELVMPALNERRIFERRSRAISASELAERIAPIVADDEDSPMAAEDPAPYGAPPPGKPKRVKSA